MWWCLGWSFCWANHGWGLLSRFPPFRYFPDFSTSPKHLLTIEYRVHIWQVSPQLSCRDTCQIWMRFKECNRYFCEIANFAYGEIDERSFSNPHPRLRMLRTEHPDLTHLFLDKDGDDTQDGDDIQDGDGIGGDNFNKSPWMKTSVLWQDVSEDCSVRFNKWKTSVGFDSDLAPNRTVTLF